jgi:hypothetical protein
LAEPSASAEGRGFHDLGQTTLHPRLADLLQRLQVAERAAVGERRRPTFRLMRDVLGSALALGVPVRLLSDCLGTTPGSVRNRACRLDAVVAPALMTELTGLTPARLDRLSGGLLSAAPAQRPVGYPTSTVVRALLATPRQEPLSAPAARGSGARSRGPRRRR